MEAHKIGMENPAAIPRIASMDKSPDSILRKNAPINLPSAICDANTPSKKNAVPTRMNFCGLDNFRFRIIPLSLYTL
jgi:hypothetical protein